MKNIDSFLVIINITAIIIIVAILLDFSSKITNSSLIRDPANIYNDYEKSQKKISELEITLGILKYKLIECKKEKKLPRVIVCE